MASDRIGIGPRRLVVSALFGVLLVAACSGPSSSAAQTTWTPLADPSAFQGADVVAAVAGGPGAVTVGAVNEDGHQVATAWTSSDGLSWSRSPAVPGFTDQVFAYLARLGDGLVAIAFQCPSSGGGECVGERPWTSPDGVSWVAGQFPQLEESGMATCCQVSNLGAAGPGLTAVAAAAGGIADGEVVTSTDGKAWTVMPRDPGWLTASLNAVAPAGTGVVVVGNHADGTFGAWTSGDETTWTPATVSGATTGDARNVVAGGPGLVAVGRDGASAAVWTSADGTVWTRLPDSDAFTGGAMNRVVAVGSTLVAVGKVGADGAIWTSPDGLSWTRQTPDAFKGYQLTNVVPVAGRVVVFGRTPTSSLGVWTTTLP